MGRGGRSIISGSATHVTWAYFSALPARHLAQLKEIDFPDIPSDELTPEEIVVIANRYNMGGSAPIEKIRQHYYGQRFVGGDRTLDDIRELLYPDMG